MEERDRELDRAYHLHADRLFRVCLKFSLGDRQWAFDRVQESFVKFAEN